MRPMNPDGQSWGNETSNLALQDLRSKVIVDLNARDEKRSQGKLNAENRFSPYREVEREGGKGSTFVVDPVLAAIKHTGDELIKLTGKRWAVFCSAPQDEKPYVEKLLRCTRENQLAEMQAAGQAVEDSLGAVADVDLPLVSKAIPKKKEPALIG